ncbi:MAG TPA: c-type cytochrome [Gemmatimonadales bacterium]|jgi:hypothetical protein
MRHARLLVAAITAATTLSCAPNTASTGKAPTPTPATSAPAAGATPPPVVPTGRASAPQSTTGNTPPAPPPNGRPVAANGGPPGGPPAGFQRRPQLTPEQRAARRDSLTAIRTQVVAMMMQRIAGNENRPAGDEFTNVRLMKDSTSAALIKTMDYFGKSLSVSCTYCHEPDGKWDDDTKEEKQTARVMIELVNMINTNGLSKLPPNRSGRTPTISCVTCHRGNTGPGTALLP